MRATYCLQTDTQQRTVDALHAAGLIDPDGNPIDCDIDFMGAIYFADGTVDSRFHTNLLCPAPLTAEQEQMLPLVYPANPVRVWA